jgi:hypothetical protein
MTSPELKTILSDKFGQMYQLMISETPDPIHAQALLDELVTQLIGKMK